MPKAKRRRCAKAEAKRGGGRAESIRRARRVTRRSMTARTKSRACGSRIPTGRSSRRRASPSATSPSITCSSRTASCRMSSTGRSVLCAARDGARGRLLLPEARLARLSRRLQADPHQGEIGHRRLSLHRGRARPRRRRADGRARAAHLGLARRRRREARPHRLRPRSRRGLAFAHVTRRGEGHARRGLRSSASKSFPMVTGGKGIHVVVPLKRGHSWDDIALCRGAGADDGGGGARPLSRQHVEGEAHGTDLRRLSAQRARRDRDRPFSTRARKGAYVAMPVSWPQLAKLKNAHPVAVGDATRFIGT